MQILRKRNLQKLGWLLICILVINLVILSKSVVPQTSINIPTSTETRNTTVDIYQRLLEKRIIFLGQAIDSKVATSIIAQMLYLEKQDPTQNIYFYINSPGGSVIAGMAIYDTMQNIKPDVVTISTGLSASMAAVLLAAGTKGKRLAMTHSRIMIHQPLANPNRNGENVNLNVQAREVAYFKKKLTELLAKLTNQSIERIEKDTQTEFFMSAIEAKNYGIIDQVIERKPGNVSLLKTNQSIQR